MKAEKTKHFSNLLSYSWPLNITDLVESTLFLLKVLNSQKLILSIYVKIINIFLSCEKIMLKRQSLVEPLLSESFVSSILILTSSKKYI